MLARLNSVVRPAMTTLALTTLALTMALPAAAQRAQADGRWQAWLGCWAPAATLIRVVGRSANSVVCVVPSSTNSAVDVLTVSGGKIIDRTHVDTDGQPHTIAKEGCTGWQSAKWAPSARRVYLKSEFNCSGAPATHVSAVYAMAGSGEWIDVQGMRVDKNSGVHAVRYREAVDAGTLPEEITLRLHDRTMARMAAMLAVTEPPSLADVVEASRELDPSVVSTWLIEADKLTVQRPTPLNAKQLVQLADNGVPASVIDVMLGLSYPNVLAVNPSSYGVARQNTDSAYMAYGSYGSYGSRQSLNPLIGFDRFGFPIYASESALMYGCSPFMYGPYDAGWNLYSQYACGRYGFGNGYGYGYSGYPGYGSGYGYGGYPYPGGYFGGGPVVVPQPTGSTAPGTPSHGRVVNGKGYTQGGNGSDGGTATPRSNNTSPSSSNAGAGSAAASNPPPRTAEPKKP
jgi:hypothetical protein